MMKVIFAFVLGIAALLAGRIASPRLSPQRDAWLSENDVNELAASIAPSAGSVNEVEEIIAMQLRATPQDQRRIFGESFISVFTFSDCVHPNQSADFTAANYPQIAKLFDRVDREAAKVIEKAQQRLHRKAPDSPKITRLQVAADDALNDPASYPAGNIVRARVFARILAEVFAENRQQLLEASERIAGDAVVAGSQFPSDVEPGIALGDAIADRLLRNLDRLRGSDATALTATTGAK